MIGQFNEKLGKELKLIMALTDNRDHTAQELSEILGTSRRNLYNYLGMLRESGFIVRRTSKTYNLDPRSPFLMDIAANLNFSEPEANYLYRLAEAAGDDLPLGEIIKRKLRRYYDLKALTDESTRNRMVANIGVLHAAMEQKRLVMLKGYSSPHSQTVSNRIVEPFMFVQGENDVRCYELLSGKNKTFKVTRMQEVIMAKDLRWSHEYAHRPVFTDLFEFSGEERHHIHLRLGQLSTNLMLEEYPRSSRFVTRHDNGTSDFETDVVSFLGIGRFVLGLYDDIEVVESPEFREYLREKIARWSKR